MKKGTKIAPLLYGGGQQKALRPGTENTAFAAAFGFVAQKYASQIKQNEKIYVQVTQEIKSEKTQKREYEQLLEIRDNYPKYVVMADDFAGGNYEGIKTMNIVDFLLSKEY